MNMRASLRPGDPAAGPVCERGATVQREREFERDVRPAEICSREIAREAAQTGGMLHTGCIHPRRPETFERLAIGARVWVAHAGDHARDA